MQIRNQELILICAFRYALGRATYMPSLVAEELERNWEHLQKWQQDQILEDIKNAIENDMAGMDCDKRMWAGFSDRVKRNKCASMGRLRW